MAIAGNDTKALFANFVNQAWKEITNVCPNHCGTDDFHKGICNHKDNSSYGYLDGHEGMMRCSILACPHKERAYSLAKKLQATTATRSGGLDLFRERRPHLRVVKTA